VKIPATHRLSELEIKLLNALQKALRDNVFFVANGHVFKMLPRGPK